TCPSDRATSTTTRSRSGRRDGGPATVGGRRMADDAIRGMLRDPSGDRPVPGLEVDAWDTAQVVDGTLGRARSGARGEFEIPLTAALGTRLLGRTAEVFFTVLADGGQVLADTRDTVRWHPAEPAPVVIPVAVDPASDNGGPSDVHGRVLTDRGTAATGLRVEV